MTDCQTTLDELATVFEALPDALLETTTEHIAAAGKIVLYGCGREGLQMRG